MSDDDVLEYMLLTMTRDILVYRSPKDTRNLAINGIVLKNNKLIIGNEQVPYAFETNVDWSYLPHRKGRQNPNQGWVDNGVLQAMRIFASRYGYRVVVE